LFEVLLQVSLFEGQLGDGDGPVGDEAEVKFVVSSELRHYNKVVVDVFIRLSSDQHPVQPQYQVCLERVVRDEHRQRKQEEAQDGVFDVVFHGGPDGVVVSSVV